MLIEFHIMKQGVLCTLHSFLSFHVIGFISRYFVVILTFLIYMKSVSLLVFPCGLASGRCLSQYLQARLDPRGLGFTLSVPSVFLLLTTQPMLVIHVFLPALSSEIHSWLQGRQVRLWGRPDVGALSLNVARPLESSVHSRSSAQVSWGRLRPRGWRQPRGGVQSDTSRLWKERLLLEPAPPKLMDSWLRLWGGVPSIGMLSTPCRIPIFTWLLRMWMLLGTTCHKRPRWLSVSQARFLWSDSKEPGSCSNTSCRLCPVSRSFCSSQIQSGLKVLTSERQNTQGVTLALVHRGSSRSHEGSTSQIF